MPDSMSDPRERLAQLSGSSRRMLDYVAVLSGGASYALLRHLIRLPEPDMIADLREAVDAGLLAVLPGRPNAYGFADEALREIILAQIGEARLPKLRARAEAARSRVDARDE